MERPTFTVGLATYNQLEQLKLVVEALGRQTFKDFELIVCDDGSSDGTAEWAETQDFEYIWQEDDGFRLAKSKNNGIKKAKGLYFLSLEADVIPHFRLLEEYKIWARPDTIMLGVRHDILQLPDELDFDKLDSMIVSKDFRGNTLRMVSKVDRPWRLCSGCNFVMPTDKLQEIGGWDENYRGYGIDDWDVCLRLVSAGCKIMAVPGAYGYHLRHEQRELPPENYKRFEKLERLYYENRSGI